MKIVEVKPSPAPVGDEYNISHYREPGIYELRDGKWIVVYNSSGSLFSCTVSPFPLVAGNGSVDIHRLLDQVIELRRAETLAEALTR